MAVIISVYEMTKNKICEGRHLYMWQIQNESNRSLNYFHNKEAIEINVLCETCNNLENMEPWKD